jgi:hypothetical protein
MSYDPYSKNLIPVYDMQKSAFRIINAETIIEIKAEKEVYTFKEGTLV